APTRTSHLSLHDALPISGVPITGVVREVKNIANMPYATISVGSADQVAPGMEFKVISSNGDYLGAIVVDTVTPNEATGKITGPRSEEHTSELQSPYDLVC